MDRFTVKVEFFAGKRTCGDWCRFKKGQMGEECYLEQFVVAVLKYHKGWRNHMRTEHCLKSAKLLKKTKKERDA